MIAVLKNNFKRMQTQMVVLLVVFATMASISAIFVSTGIEAKWQVAVVTPEGAVLEEVAFPPTGNEVPLKTPPQYSDLVSGRYDGILTVAADGSYTFESIKSPETEDRILRALAGEAGGTALFADRGTGTNVLGFLMMFLLLMGSMCMTMYVDDRTFGQIARVAASPLKIGTYLFAHCLYNFCYLFFPTLLILTVVKWASRVAWGYSFGQLAGLLALLCALSTIFALLLFTFVSNKGDSAKMAGNSVIILTSILAGGFYTFEKGNRALELAIALLPQKMFLDLAAGVESGAPLAECLYPLIYLAVLLVAGYLLSVSKTQRDFVNKE